MKTILITGVTGFVGSALLRILKNKDCNILAVVRDKKKLKWHSPRLSVIESDNIFAESQEWWVQVMTDVDVVVHVAWAMKQGNQHDLDLNLQSMNCSIVMARAAVEANIEKFIGIGTCFEYDLTTEVIATATSLIPKSVYGATKAATYLIMNSIFLPSNTVFSWCRLFYLYGDGEHKDRLYSYVKNTIMMGSIVELTSGTQVRDYMHINVAAEKIIDVIESDCSGPINICSGVGITVKEFCESIADKYGRRDLLRFGNRQRAMFDPNFIVGKPSI